MSLLGLILLAGVAWALLAIYVVCLGVAAKRAEAAMMGYTRPRRLRPYLGVRPRARRLNACSGVQCRVRSRSSLR